MMKTHTFPSVLLALFLTLNLIPDKVIGQNIQESSAKKSIAFEKVYLHLDRNFYACGEDIWFKAYLVNAFTNKLFDNSNCLYVELISPQSSIIQREIIELKDGTGYGDFHLKDSLPSGKYQIRAYTNWMLNFGNYFFFTKEIQVESLIGINTPDIPHPAEIEDTGIDISFYPEGGSLIENIYSKVAFKAVNRQGEGCPVSGFILSSNGDTMARMETLHLGMGSFQLRPKNGMSYFAIGTDDKGRSFKFNLPAALETGYSLNINDYDSSNLSVNIRTNPETFEKSEGKKFYLVGTSRGTLCLEAEIKKNALNTNFLILKDNFPEGIAQLTILDSAFRPQCERLFFIHHQSHVNVMITSDRKVYKARQKVTLQIAARDTANKPLRANLSLSVIDAGQVKNPDNDQSGIASYFLLESDIKGRIEQPGWYFDASHEDRFKALDLLLLTQGWRDFVWKHLADSTLKVNHYIEKGINISGKLRRLFVDKPIANANISMALFSENKMNYLNLTKTDSTGRYLFPGLDFSGTKTLIISATDKNNRSKGWIMLDSTFNQSPRVNYHWTPQNKIIPKELSVFKSEAESRNNILKKYSLKDTIQLNEVVVTAHKEKKEDDGHDRIYGTPDFSLTVTDQYASYSDIFQLLQGRVAGLMISGNYPNISFSMRGSSGAPLFLLDGIPVDIDMIASVPLTSVDKIEVLKDVVNL
ncbi:MAG: TonB-dependent receptor plug domain-containing protein, partial [Bacteroidota bacterium]|nr:TonB-dependent receptor plug domain-containing protein [Bacteroidota bacterium]